jgi:hypothetical protein
MIEVSARFFLGWVFTILIDRYVSTAGYAFIVYGRYTTALPGYLCRQMDSGKGEHACTGLLPKGNLHRIGGFLTSPPRIPSPCCLDLARKH